MKTRAVTYVVTGEGDDRSIATEKAFDKQVKAAKEAGGEEPTFSAVQTFQVYEVENTAEFLELVTNEEEQKNIINRALVLKQQQGARAILLADNFEQVEGTYDLRELCGELRERRAATPAEKALSALGKLSAEELAAVMAQFQAASGG